MAVKNVKSSLVYLRLSTVSVAEALVAETAKLLMCEVDISWDTTADVAETPTKNCGTFKVAGIPSHTLTGEGVIVGNLGANEVSAQQLKIWANSQTTVYVALANEADSPLLINTAAYLTGSGYFSSVGMTFTTADGMGKFSWEFALNGDVDLVP